MFLTHFLVISWVAVVRRVGLNLQTQALTAGADTSTNLKNFSRSTL